MFPDTLEMVNPNSPRNTAEVHVPNIILQGEKFPLLYNAYIIIIEISKKVTTIIIYMRNTNIYESLDYLVILSSFMPDSIAR